MPPFRPIENPKKLALIANTIRQDLLKALNAAGSGHSGGSLGMADIFTVLYFSSLRHDPKRPRWDGRDRVVLSNGHICPVLYATLAHAGYFPVKELMTLRKLGSRLQGHPHRSALPGLETTSGPLGSGLSQASGMAYAARMDKKKHHVFALTSDGEHQEGNHWEAVQFAGKYRLSNLIQILDRNYIQIEGNTEDIMPLDPVKEKYEAFHWQVKEVDGHRITDIQNAISEARAEVRAPVLIIARTVPGKGASYMEDEYTWHGKPPNNDELEVALKDLQNVRQRIEEGSYEY